MADWKLALEGKDIFKIDPLRQAFVMQSIPKLLSAKPLPGYRLLLVFENQETRVFDVSIYLDKGVFTELLDESYFWKVSAHPNFVSWPHELNLSRETLYLRSSSAQ